MEIWKDIIGYEGLYQVSNLGNVKSLERYRKGNKGIDTYVPEKLRATQIMKIGYISVDLYKNNIRTTKYIHRLIAEAFIPNPENKSDINHIDGDKANCSIDNLEWVSHQENMIHAAKNGLRIPPKGEKQGSSKLRNADVIRIREMVNEGYAMKYLSELFGVGQDQISRIKNRRLWKHI